MKRWIIVSGLVAAGCGSVKDPPACSTSADCPAGQYCAATQGEHRCWPDANPPVVSAVSIQCVAPAGGACPRDGTLRVTATASDAEELADVRVSVRIDAASPAASVAMTRSGDTWTADVPLAPAAMSTFDGAVDATVTARDGARNEASMASATSVPVTRLRWTAEVEPGIALTAAAVTSDGTAVVAGGNGKLYFVKSDGTRARDPLTVGTGQAITAAPAIGSRAIWVGSEDGVLRGVDATGVMTGVTVNSDAAIRGGIAVLTEAGRESGFATSVSGRVVAVSTALDVARTGASTSYVAGPVIDSQARVYSVTSATSSVLRSFTYDGAFTERWGDQSPAVGVNVVVPPVIVGGDDILTVAQDGKLNRTTSAGATVTIGTFDQVVIDSPVVLAGGDIIVGDQGGLLHRLSSSGEARWTPAKSLSGAVLSALVLTGTPATLLVPTRSGMVYALDDTGAELWSHSLGTGAELRTGNIFTAPGQAAGHVVSTAYFPTSDGKLHAVIVDGQLDTAAPWPKAFHDARNTSNAGTAP